MKYYLPNNTIGYLQTNKSDRLGSLWSTFNIDLQKKIGTIKLSDKLVNNTSSADNANLGLPVAFQYWNNKWWAICGNRIFKSTTNSITSQFTEDLTAHAIGDSTSQFDITNPSGTVFRYTWDGTGTDPKITSTSIPIGAKVSIFSTSFAAGNRSKDSVTVTGSGTNYFEITNTTGVVESDKVIDGGFISIEGGTFSTDYSIISSDLALFNDYLFTSKNDGIYYKSSYSDTDNGAFFSFRKLYNISTDYCHQMCYFKKYNRLYFIRTEEDIGSIDTNLTVSTSSDYTLVSSRSIGLIRTMAPNSQHIWIGSIRTNTNTTNTTNNLTGVIYQWDGFSSQVTNAFEIKTGGILAMTVLNDVPYAIDTSGRILQYTGYSFKEISRLPNSEMLLNGSSTLLPANGFGVHFNGFIATKNNTLLISVNNLLEDGSINENMPSGIWECDVTNGNLTHKYSPTLKDFDSNTITDYGQNKIVSSGAIKENSLSDYTTDGKSNIVAGFKYYTNATGTKSGVFIDSPKKGTTDYEGQKRGYFITTWFDSSEIVSTWNRLWSTFKKFLNSTDKMVFKYRVNDEEPIYADITWTTTNTFTTTTDISGYTRYEVEIIQGTGSGTCANISTVTELSGTYTATIDTAITGVTGTSKARFQKWIKLLPDVTGQVLSYGQCPITVTDTRIQIKGIMEWTGDNELHKIVLVDTENLKITP